MTRYGIADITYDDETVVDVCADVDDATTRLAATLPGSGLALAVTIDGTWHAITPHGTRPLPAPVERPTTGRRLAQPGQHETDRQVRAYERYLGLH